MIGTTLDDIRSHIEALASENGTYFLICARYGDRPVPAADLRFETRTAARAAASATEQYRAALRRYDPRLPHYDIVVCQESREFTRCERDTETEQAGGSDPTHRSNDTRGSDDRTLPGEHPGASTHGRSDRVDFCHSVAAAVFEALSDAGHDDVESAVMDAYFRYAERVADLDDLCVCLLESMATEIDRRLTPDEQAEIASAAAARLPAPPASDHPVAATFALLERQGLLGSYVWSPTDPDGDARAVVARLSDYVLSPRDDRLPVLPIVVELLRHRSERGLSSLAVTDVDGEWAVRLAFDRDAGPSGLASAPVRSEV